MSPLWALQVHLTSPGTFSVQVNSCWNAPEIQGKTLERAFASIGGGLKHPAKAGQHYQQRLGYSTNTSRKGHICRISFKSSIVKAGLTYDIPHVHLAKFGCFLDP